MCIGFISKNKYFFQSFLSSLMFVDSFSQFQVGSCKYQFIIRIISKLISSPPDYDTIETVTCKSHYIHDEERQRSLQHFIQIEDLPEKFTKVNLPSGLLTIIFVWVLSSNINISISSRVLRCLWFSGQNTEETNAVRSSGSLNI